MEEEAFNRGFILGYKKALTYCKLWFVDFPDKDEIKPKEIINLFLFHIDLVLKEIETIKKHERQQTKLDFWNEIKQYIGILPDGFEKMQEILIKYDLLEEE